MTLAANLSSQRLASSGSSAAGPDMLVVDLDGTLTTSDLLFETFWSAISARWLNLFQVLRASLKGRAHLKRTLAQLNAPSVASLPYNDRVIDYIRAWRERGGATALVSASDQALVEAVADHVGLFDEAYGSDGATNLKGHRKAAFLKERFPSGFTYMGDAHADYPVWREARHAVAVGATPRLRRRLESLPCLTEHIEFGAGRGVAILRALRPHQWLKNALVFLPMLVAHQFDAATFGSTILAGIAFSMVASSVYVLNDLLDLASDRAHPRKRNRPLASGALPLSYGTMLAPALLLGGLMLSMLLGWVFLSVMAGYYVVTLLYSFTLKRRLIVDICTLAGLYTLRIVAGAAATGIPLSMWLLAFSTFFFFSLAAMKREAELVSGIASGQVKAHGRGYVVGDLPLVANMAVSSGYVSVLVMALYVNSDAVRVLYAVPEVLWGICLVLLYWISRMVMITHRGWMHDDPVVFAARDPNSLACAIMIFAFAVVGTML